MFVLARAKHHLAAGTDCMATNVHRSNARRIQSIMDARVTHTHRHTSVTVLRYVTTLQRVVQMQTNRTSTNRREADEGRHTQPASEQASRLTTD